MEVVRGVRPTGEVKNNDEGCNEDSVMGRSCLKGEQSRESIFVTERWVGTNLHGLVSEKKVRNIKLFC